MDWWSPHFLSIHLAFIYCTSAMYQVLCQRNRDESTGLPLKKEKEKKKKLHILLGVAGGRKGNSHRQTISIHCKDLSCIVVQGVTSTNRQTQIQTKKSREGFPKKAMPEPVGGWQEIRSQVKMHKEGRGWYNTQKDKIQSWREWACTGKYNRFGMIAL